MKRSVIFLVLSVILSKICFSQNDCGACEQLKNNVVKITTSFSDGSDENGFGTVIAEKADKLYIVTAKHVVYKLEDGRKSLDGNPKSVNVRFYKDQGNDHPAHLLSLSDNVYDITLLEVTKPQNFIWTKDFYSTSIVRGTQVWFIGRGGKWYIPTGPRTGTINELTVDDEIIIDINSIQPGTSGAPLISKDGMVGVIFEDASTGAKAYPIERVKKIIANWNYDWQMNSIIYKGTGIQDIDKLTPSYKIGQSFGGGIIFYIDESGKHGLIAAPYDQSEETRWGCPTTIIVGGTGKELGTGKQNTINIITDCTEAGIAAKICSDLKLGGYSDWYLPSKDELNKLYLNKGKVGGLNNDRYWSSSEDKQGVNNAWFQDFDNGHQDFIDQNNRYRVRAVRNF